MENLVKRCAAEMSKKNLTLANRGLVGSAVAFFKIIDFDDDFLSFKKNENYTKYIET